MKQFSPCFLLLIAVTIVHPQSQLEEFSKTAIDKYLKNYVRKNRFLEVTADRENKNYHSSLSNQMKELEMKNDQSKLSEYHSKVDADLKSVSSSYQEMIQAIYESCDYSKAVQDQLVNVPKSDEQAMKDQAGLLKAAVDQTVDKTTSAQEKINQMKYHLTDIFGTLVPLREFLRTVAPNKRAQLENEITKIKDYINSRCTSQYSCYSTGESIRLQYKLEGMRGNVDKLAEDSKSYSDWLGRTSAEFKRLASSDEEKIEKLKLTALDKNKLLRKARTFLRGGLQGQSQENIRAYYDDISKAVKNIYDVCLEFANRGPEFFFNGMKLQV